MTIELTIEPSGEFAADDPRTSAQVTELFNALKKESDVRMAPVAAVPGKKGEPISAAIIIALGQAGVFTAVVAAFTAWLKMGRKRSLKLRVKDGKDEKVIQIDGTGMSADDVNAIMKKLV